MTYIEHWVGPGGNDANSGLSMALRKLTAQGCEDSLSAARHIVHMAPGTYREMLTLGFSGPAAYATGTVSVTQGSKVVTGLGSSWLANAELNDWFQIQVLAHGTDGVTDGTHTFVSAAGNFQAGHVGMTIRITTKAAAVIASVVSATTITLKDTAGTDITPSAGSSLTYDVGPESPYKVASVDSNTQITLAEAWSAPSFTGLAYKVWGHIEYIGDYLGQLTDGIGGVVRITGSNDDKTATRANVITATSKNNRSWSGLLANIVTSTLITAGGSNWVFDGCVLDHSNQIIGPAVGGISSITIGQTYKRCTVLAGQNGQIGIVASNGITFGDMALLVESCIFLGPYNIWSTRMGGITVRHSTFYFAGGGASVGVGIALAVGQCITAYGNTFIGCRHPFEGTAVGQVLEDYNCLSGSQTDRTNVTAGAHDNGFAPLFDSRWFFNLVFRGAGPYNFFQMVTPFDLAADSPLLNVAGLNPPTTDMRGTAKQSANGNWGALQQDSTLKHLGGLKKSRVDNER